MLIPRILTALALMAVLLPALFSELPWPFVTLLLVMVAAAGWEWGRLNALAQGAAMALGAAVLALCAALWVSGWTNQTPVLVWWLATLLWVPGAVWALRAGPAGWPRLPMLGRLLLGVAMLVLAWLAMSQARKLGINFILSVFALVWVADVFAYAGGRLLGKRKLAPTISPGKSWEGVAAGVSGVVLAAFVWQWVDTLGWVDGPSLYTLLHQRWAPWVAALILLFLVAMSVVGDLVESLIKRAVGAKDSSRLLPGHGGVLDRIDALLPVFPLAMAWVSL